MKEQIKEKELKTYNLLNNGVAKVALAASLLITGGVNLIDLNAPVVSKIVGAEKAEASESSIRVDLKLKWTGTLQLGAHKRGIIITNYPEATSYDVYEDDFFVGSFNAASGKTTTAYGKFSLKDIINLKVIAKNSEGNEIVFDESKVNTMKTYTGLNSNTVKKTSELELLVRRGNDSSTWFYTPISQDIIDTMNEFIDENPEMYVYRYYKTYSGTIRGLITYHHVDEIVISDKPVWMITEQYTGMDQHYNKNYSFLRFAEDATVKKLNMTDINQTEFSLGVASFSPYEWAVPDSIANATLLVEPTATYSVEEKTFENILVTANFDEKSIRNQYRFNGGEWFPYEGPITISQNGLLELQSTDAMARTSSVYSKQITNKLDPNTIGQKDISELNAGDKVFFSEREWTLLDPLTGLLGGNEIIGESTFSKAFSYLDNTYLQTFTQGEQQTIIDYPWVRDGKTSTVSTQKIGFLNKSQATNYLELIKGDGLTYWLNSTDTIFPSSGVKNITYIIQNGSTLTYVESGLNGIKPFIHLPLDTKVTNGNVIPQEYVDTLPPNAPILTPDKTGITNLDVTVTIDYTNDSETKEYNLNDMGWQMYEGPVVISGNATIKARGVDESGNVSEEETLIISNIDKIAPDAPVLFPDTEDITKGNVTVTITYPSDAKTKQYSIDNGKSWKTYSSKVSMTTNGTILARSLDLAGNISEEGVLVIENIDKEKPDAPMFSPSTTEPTNQDVSIVIEYPSDSVLNEYQINNGAWTVYSEAITLTANGTVRARAKDAAGNVSSTQSLSINSIDKVAPTKPTLKASTTSTTTGNVKVVITYPSGTAKKQYQIDDGEWLDYTTAVEISDNGVVNARAIDAAGNISPFGTINISNIQKVVPNTPTFTASITDLTNQDLHVTINYSSDSAIKEYSVDDGKWMTYSEPIVLKENGTIKARAANSSGKYSEEGLIIIENIDKVAPTLPLLNPNTNESTNTSVKVTINYSKDSTIKEYRINGGEWMAYTSVVIVDENAEVEARGIDSAGNESEVGFISITNIDKEIPDTPTLVPSTTEIFNGDVTVSIDFPSDVVKKEFSIDGGEWTTYLSPIILTKNSTIKARGIDDAGNESREGVLVVKNIDKIMPIAPKISLSTTAATNKKIMVSIDYPDDANKKEFSIDGEEWKSYISSFEVGKNVVIKARAIDKAGNNSEESLVEVNNIDTTAPNVPTFSPNIKISTIENVSLEISYSPDSIIKEYSLNGKDWLLYTVPLVFKENGKVMARGTDAVGNVSTEGIFEVKNIDRILPDAPTILVDQTEPTNTNVKVTITYPDDADKKEYSINNGVNWVQYTAPISMKENGEILARAVDKAGNISTVISVEVNNIDKILPSPPEIKADMTEGTNKGVTIEITYSLDSIKKEYSVDGVTWIAYIKPFATHENGVIKARGIDKAGNISFESVFEVNNIDKTAPNKPTIISNNSEPTNENVVVSVSYPKDGVKNEVEINGGKWEMYSGPITMKGNGVIQARTTDASGNTSLVETFTIGNIDKVAPTEPIITIDKSTVTNGYVIASILYPSDSVVKEYSIDGGLTWESYSMNLVIEENMVVKARAIDAVGNVSSLGYLDVSNIDKEAPSAATFKSSDTSITEEPVFVTILYPQDAKVKEYRLGTSGDWLLYTSSVEIVENGSIYARSSDEAGNISKESYLIVNNIEIGLNDAIQAVIEAETSKVQEDIDQARGLVNSLRNKEVKTELENRLNTVQKSIDDAIALVNQIATATTSVSKAEGSKLQADVNSAKALVNALPTGTEKTNLTTRLATVQKGIDDAIALANQIAVATTSVTKAEGSKLQVDVDSAKALVTSLPNGTEKTNLTNRLTAVQKVIDDVKAIDLAKEIVRELGDNPTQEELDAAKDKINELSDGPAKELLLDLIDKAQGKLDAEKAATEELLRQIELATKAVEKSETSETQSNIDEARKLVNTLKNEDVKTELTNRLDVVQEIVDKAKMLELVYSLVNKLGENPTQEQIDHARTEVEALSNSEDKTKLFEIVDVKQKALDVKIVDAEKAVQNIGNPPGQEEINQAQIKVELLPVGKVKDELQLAIEKQRLILEANNQILLARATDAVIKAEEFPTNYNITIATNLVASLSGNGDKTSLLNRLQGIQDKLAVEKAEIKVKQAENYERDPYLKEAMDSVNALKDGKEKQALKDRLQTVLDKLDAEKEEEVLPLIPNEPNAPDWDISKEIEGIADAEAKLYFTNWNKAVVNAEKYPSKSTAKNTKVYLDGLTNSYKLYISYHSIIQYLTEKTEKLGSSDEQPIVDVFAPIEKAVVAYEKYLTNYYLNKAKELVGALPDSKEKASFEKRLGLNKMPVEETIESPEQLALRQATGKAVANYEKYKSAYYQKKAMESIELLIESKERTAFQARFDAVTK